jgi:hypothetical protein
LYDYEVSMHLLDGGGWEARAIEFLQTSYTSFSNGGGFNAQQWQQEQHRHPRF